jgi:hypothetical protein
MSLEPLPHRVSQAGRGPFVSQNVNDDGSRFASEPASLSARESQIPELPTLRSKQVADSVLGATSPPAERILVILRGGRRQLLRQRALRALAWLAGAISSWSGQGPVAGVCRPRRA